MNFGVVVIGQPATNKSSEKVGVYFPLRSPSCWAASSSLIEALKSDDRFELFCEGMDSWEQRFEALSSLGLQQRSFDHFLKVPGRKILVLGLDYEMHHNLLWQYRWLKIPSVGIQHGIECVKPEHFPDEFRPMCDVTLRWSESGAQVIVERFKRDPHSVIAIGNPKIRTFRERKRRKEHEGSAASSPYISLLLTAHNQILLPYGHYRLSSEQLSEHIRQIARTIAESFPGSRCLVRAHISDESKLSEYKLELEARGLRVEWAKSVDLFDLIADSTMCFVVNSSVYVDSVLMGKPTVHFIFGDSLVVKSLPGKSALLKEVDLQEGNTVEAGMAAIRELIDLEAVAPDDLEKFRSETWGLQEDPVAEIAQILLSHARAPKLIRQKSSLLWIRPVLKKLLPREVGSRISQALGQLRPKTNS